MNRTWIIVLNWNNWPVTSECLASLRLLKDVDFNVVMVDNGSTDDSVARIGAQFPEVEIIATGKNLGFASGNNWGIRAAMEHGAEYVWLLNDDTAVHPLALRTMLEKAQSDPAIGAVGSAIYDWAAPQMLQVWGGGVVNFWLGRSHHFTTPVKDDRIEFLTGASLLIRCSALEKVGLFDEGYFLYWEDSDFCFRLRRAGWRLAVAGNSKVWHKGGSSSGKNQAKLDLNLTRSAVRFFRRNAPLPVVPLAVSTTLRLARRVMLGDWERCRAVWWGVTTE